MCVKLRVPFSVKGEALYSLAYVPPYPCQGKPKRGLVIRSCDHGYTFDISQVGIRHNCQLSGFYSGYQLEGRYGLYFSKYNM